MTTFQSEDLPNLHQATEGEEIARERINWLEVDQLIQLSIYDEETVLRRIGDARYMDEIQHILNDLRDNQHDDLVTQKGIGKVVQRAIDLDDYRDSKNGNQRKI